MSVLIRFHNDSSFSLLGNKYFSLLLFVNISWLLVSNVQKIYSLQAFTSKNRYTFAVIAAIGLQLIIGIGFNGMIKTFYSRLFLVITYLSFSVLLYLGRKITQQFYKTYLKKKLKQSVIVLVGEETVLEGIESFFKLNLSTKKQEVKRIQKKENLLEELKELKEEHFISEVYLPLSQFNEDDIEEVSNFCDNYFIRLRLIFDWKKVSARKMTATKINQTTIFKLALTPLDDPFNALLKRTFDLLFSLMLCIFLFSWLFPIIAICIKLNSKGPVFFKQVRSGINNKGFQCYKFRSMRPNKEADSVQATSNDSRITKVGAFLRKTSLDELPQFINVIRGEMSIVGPRPHMLKHTEEYSQLVGNFMNRHAIRPGITGLAQIKGYRGEIDDFTLLQNRIRLDRFYVNNWTLFFDIRIVALTFIEVFKDHR